MDSETAPGVRNDLGSMSSMTMLSTKGGIPMMMMMNSLTRREWIPHREEHAMGIDGNESGVRRRIGLWRVNFIAGLLALIAVAAAGCGAATPAQMAPSADPEPTVGVGDATPAQTVQPSDGIWVLESMDGQPVIENSFVMLNVNEDLATGFDGCNRYGLRSVDGAPVFDVHGKFSVPTGYRTERDCAVPEGVMDQAGAYFSTLMRLDRFRISGDRLEILDSEGRGQTGLRQAGATAGGSCRPAGHRGGGLINQGDARAATMSFLDDRLVTGVTACRAYLATYRRTEGGIRFPSMSMLTYTHSCSEDASRMEGEFGDFLTWAREYAVSDEEGSRLLRMRSSRGKTLTFEPLSPTAKDIADAEWTLVAFVELREIDVGSWTTRTTTVIEGTDVTISFDEDGLSGSSGCNSYTGLGSVEYEAATIDVQTLSHTEKVCEGLDGLMGAGGTIPRSVAAPGSLRHVW